MKVTILTPTYNQEKYIGQCIRSAIAQTYENWEQIVIDDASTDRTAEIVRSFGDRRIRLISNSERLGVERLAQSYNKGLRVAEGELVAVLEGDDYWPPDKLARQVPAFADAQVVLSWAQTAIDRNGQILETVPQKGRYDPSRYRTSCEWLLAGNALGAVTAVIRRSALTQIGGFYQVPETVMLDYSTWLRLSLLGQFHRAPGVGGYWRVHSSQTTHVKRKETLRATALTIEDFLQREESAGLLSAAARRASIGRQLLLRGQVAHLEKEFWQSVKLYCAAAPKIDIHDLFVVFKLTAMALLRRDI